MTGNFMTWSLHSIQEPSQHSYQMLSQSRQVAIIRLKISWGDKAARAHQLLPVTQAREHLGRWTDTTLIPYYIQLFSASFPQNGRSPHQCHIFKIEAISLRIFTVCTIQTNVGLHLTSWTLDTELCCDFQKVGHMQVVGMNTSVWVREVMPESFDKVSFPIYFYIDTYLLYSYTHKYI